MRIRRHKDNVASGSQSCPKEHVADKEVADLAGDHDLLEEAERDGNDDSGEGEGQDVAEEEPTEVLPRREATHVHHLAQATLFLSHGHESVQPGCQALA